MINKYLYKVLFGGDLISKSEVDLKANYKLNYDVPKLSSYQQVREEQKYKSKSQLGGSADGSSTNDTKLPEINKNQQENTKVVITGDDVLIEYVTRLIEVVEKVEVGKEEFEHIESFITHYVWHSEDVPNQEISERLQNRLSEMILRRKKLLKSL